MSLLINTLKLDLGMKLMTELSKIDRLDASWAIIEKREGASFETIKIDGTKQIVFRTAEHNSSG